jgi:hypothetical protein
MKNPFFLIIPFVIFGIAFANAQSPPPCPITDADGIHPLSTESNYVPWTGAEEDIEIVGTTCTLRTKYCYRAIVSFPCIPPHNCTTYQRYVHEITLIGNCAGYTEIIARNYATNYLWGKLMPGDTIPPCDYTLFPRMLGIMPACWNRTGDDPNYTYRSCAGAKCYTMCKLCQDGASVIHFDCVHQVSEEPSCTGSPGNGCYYMACPSGP